MSLYLVTVSVWGQNAVDADTELERLNALWLEQFRTYLESSEHAQLRIASAIYLNRTGDQKAKERSEQLISEILSAPITEAAGLWLLASDCQWRDTASWCEPGGVYEQLMKADPGNAAVSMLRFSQTRFEGDKSLLDTEAHRQLLLEAADADHFDGYYGRGADSLYAEALEFIEINPMPPASEIENSRLVSVRQPHIYAFFQATGLVLTFPSLGYSNIISLCRSQARNQYTEGIMACKKLAELMRDKGRTLLTRSVGFSIERIMLEDSDPNDPGIKHWQLRGDISKVISICQSSPWQTNEQLWPEAKEPTLMNWARNLSELGEWEGNRLTAFQEYAISPDDFAINPAECDKLNELDDEAMEKFLDDKSHFGAWQAMRAMALGNSSSQ